MNANWTNEVKAMTDRELVAGWNVLTFAGLAGHELGMRIEIIRSELAARLIPYSAGKRIIEKK